MDSSVNELINLLAQKINLDKNGGPFALVLVKRCQTAYRLSKYLDSSGLRTTSLVGFDAQNILLGKSISLISLPHVYVDLL